MDWKSKGPHGSTCLYLIVGWAALDQERAVSNFWLLSQHTWIEIPPRQVAFPWLSWSSVEQQGDDTPFSIVMKISFKKFAAQDSSSIAKTSEMVSSYNYY